MRKEWGVSRRHWRQWLTSIGNRTSAWWRTCIGWMSSCTNTGWLWRTLKHWLRDCIWCRNSLEYLKIWHLMICCFRDCINIDSWINAPPPIISLFLFRSILFMRSPQLSPPIASLIISPLWPREYRTHSNHHRLQTWTPFLAYYLLRTGFSLTRMLITQFYPYFILPRGSSAPLKSVTRCSIGCCRALRYRFLGNST